MGSRTVSFARVTMLPGIVPRLGKLLFSGFGPISYLLAQTFGTLKLLQPNHPYLNPSNYGRFTLLQVMGEGRKRLVYDRHHVDQVVMYYTMMIGILILGAQFLMIALGATIHSASAALFSTYFVTVNNNTDLAFRMLDLVFGFNGIFDSCVTAGAACTPNAAPSYALFHSGLQTLFNYYNVGILAVAIIVFLYMVAMVVAETTESGTPFGHRFNGAWAPLRLIWAVGMLCPLTFGMNGAQLGTMYVAKWGSSLATNSWLTFLGSIGTMTPLGDQNSLVILPNAPPVSPLIEFIFVAQTCSHYQALMYGRVINGYLVDGPNNQLLLGYGGTGTTALTFDLAQAFANHKDIYIRFGEQSPDYANERGYVRPICGDMTISVHDITQPAALSIQRNYFDQMVLLWNDPDFQNSALALAKHGVPNELRDPNAIFPSTGAPTQQFVNDGYNFYQKYISDPGGDIDQARAAELKSGNWTETFSQLGWAGAAIWYNKLAEMNGSFINAASSLPQANNYPEVMELVSQQKRQTDAMVDPRERFRPYQANGNPIDFANPADKYEAMVEYNAQQVWADASTTRIVGGVEQGGSLAPTNSSIIDTIKMFFGLNDLFSMRDNINKGINPLAQLVGLGGSLVRSAEISLAGSFAASVGGGIVGLLGLTPLRTIGLGAAHFAATIGFFAISIGALLFYVVPFMPFLYFFFSASTWLKSIFVGLVAMPLWAIAHMRIDGEGLPGPAAMNGYFLLLEIFLRPVLMLFGLVGGLMIFSAEVLVLDQVWDLVTDNLTGFDYSNAASASLTPVGTTTGVGLGAQAGMRDIIDQFMFTIMFAVIVYMMALSSFKMCDSMPDAVLRWMGFHVQSFGTFDPNPAEHLPGHISQGAYMLFNPEQGVMASLMLRNQ